MAWRWYTDHVYKRSGSTAALYEVWNAWKPNKIVVRCHGFKSLYWPSWELYYKAMEQCSRSMSMKKKKKKKKKSKTKKQQQKKQKTNKQTNKWHVRPAKTLIRLGRYKVWSESSLSAKETLALSAQRRQTLIRPLWSESSLGAHVSLLVLSCGGSMKKSPGSTTFKDRSEITKRRWTAQRPAPPSSSV